MEDVTGIYVELVFLDAALNFGQGFFTFMLFGLNTRKIVMPLHKWLATQYSTSYIIMIIIIKHVGNAGGERLYTGRVGSSYLHGMNYLQRLNIRVNNF